MAVSPITFEVPAPRLPLSEQDRQESADAYLKQYGSDPRIEFPGVFDLEIVNAVTPPHESLSAAQTYESGCAEPWISQLVTSLLIASNQRTIFEGGGFVGQTSGWLAMTLQRLGGGELIIAELEHARADTIEARLQALPIPDVSWRVERGDVLQTIPRLPNGSIGFAWIDDCHEKPHVESETVRLWPKMKPNGIITYHDVFGTCDLQSVVRKYGGYALDLPRLGRAGGLGILQVP